MAMSKIASPKSTGGAGNTFEANVCAYYLAAMLSGVPARGLDSGPCVEVRSQRRYQGFYYDDIVVECGEAESVQRLAIQAKLRLRFSESDSAFGEVMNAAWMTFLSSAFRQGRDRVGLAIGTYGAKADEQAEQVPEWARSSATAADFFERIDQPGLSNEPMRGFLRAALGVLQTAGHRIDRDDQFWHFLRSLVIIEFDFGRPASRDYLVSLSILQGNGHQRSLDDARSLYDALFRAATKCIECAGSHRRETLLAFLGTNFDHAEKRDAQHAASDQVPSTDYYAFPRAPRDTSVFVGREDDLKELSGALVPSHGAPRLAAVCALQGMPGIGKSYLVDRLAELHREHFRGGYLRLTLSVHEERGVDELGEILADRLGLDPKQDKGWNAIRHRLREPPTLLHIENADGERSAGVAARVAAALGGCAVVVTGRFLGLGRAAGWLRRELAPFDEATAVEQLEKEHRTANADEASEFRALARALGYLPLALHLAAGYLRLEGSVTSFLTLLHDTRLRLEPSDPADELFVREPQRAVLASTFELSLGLLRCVLGGGAERLMDGLNALGHAPPSGFGECFGSALSGLSVGELNTLMTRARQLSLIEVARPRDQGSVRWRIHPLLAELLRGRADDGVVLSRRHAWFVDRVQQDNRSKPTDAMRARSEVDDEPDALAAWLGTLDGDLWCEVAEVGRAFALQNGPFHVWRGFFERGLAAQDPRVTARGRTLLTLGQLARLAGDYQRALTCAEEAVLIAKAVGEPDPLIDALSLLAQNQLAIGNIDASLSTWLNDVQPLLGRAKDVARRFQAAVHIGPALANRGEPENGLRLLLQQADFLRGLPQWATPRALLMVQAALILIRMDQCAEALTLLEEASTPLEHQGSPREFVIARDAVAQILAERDEFERALTTWNDEVIPVLERLGAKSDVAVMRNKAALMLANLGRVDAAIEVTQEQLSIFQHIGNRHGQAVSLNQLAELFGRQNREDEAIAIYLERSLPILEELQEPRELALTYHNAAYSLVRLGHPEHRTLASTLSDRAVTLGQEFQLPEVETFVEFAEEQGFRPSALQETFIRLAEANGLRPWVDGGEDDTEGFSHVWIAYDEPCPCGSGKMYERCHGRQ